MRFHSKCRRPLASGACRRERDAVGRLVSDRLRATFRGRGKLAVQVALLRTWRVDLAKLLAESYAAQVDRRVIDRAIEVIAVELMDNAPAYECRCGRNPDCRCRGREWLSHKQAEMETNKDLVPFCEES